MKTDFVNLKRKKNRVDEVRAMMVAHAFYFVSGIAPPAPTFLIERSGFFT